MTAAQQVVCKISNKYCCLYIYNEVHCILMVVHCVKLIKESTSINISRLESSIIYLFWKCSYDKNVDWCWSNFNIDQTFECFMT